MLQPVLLFLASIRVRFVPRNLLRPMWVALGGLLLAASLAACAPPVTAAQRCDAITQAVPGQRVLVSFRQATVADSPAVIEQLQVLAGACVRPVSSVSPTLHVYMVDGPVDMSVLSQRWLGWPAVSAVEADVLVRRP